MGLCRSEAAFAANLWALRSCELSEPWDVRDPIKNVSVCGFRQQLQGAFIHFIYFIYFVHFIQLLLRTLERLLPGCAGSPGPRERECEREREQD